MKVSIEEFQTKYKGKLKNLMSHLAVMNKPESKPNKYGNEKTEHSNIKFDSLKEARRFQQLQILERTGEITNLKAHPVFPLNVEGKTVGKYIADSSYFEKGVFIVEDVKSVATRKLPVFRLKRRLMKAIYGIDIREI